MVAVAWTGIGILAFAEFFMVFYLGRKLDAFEGKLNARLDTLTTRLDTHLDHHTPQRRAR